MSKPKARKPATGVPKGDLDKLAKGYHTSIVRTALAAVLVIVGIAWVTVYVTNAIDAANWVKGVGKQPHTSFPWMADLKDWNWLIGFGLIFVGLIVAAHKSTPLGRGQGVVVGMLGSFLIGLVWICAFYFLAGSDAHVPVMIYPSPLSTRNYIVLNSGHTFRAADLRGTNALLYPRLGDYAILKPTPNEKDRAAVEVVTAGLFDEDWQYGK